MAQLITVRLSKSDQQPLGFRLQGGKDFGTPLVVQKVNGGSAAERAGLQAGDALIRVNTTDVFTLRHQEAQDAIRAAGGALELTVQRGGGTWRPAVTPTGSLPRPGSRPLGASPTPVTNTSLKATQQQSRAFGSGHNNVAKPFGYMNGNDSVKSIVNKQYNTPVNIYSDKTIAETLSAQTEVLAGGVLGVNFKKNEKTYDSEKSAVFKVLQEEASDPEPVSEQVCSGNPAPPAPASGLRHVQAPITRPDAPINNTGGLPVGQNICEECERLITGVFVRIKDKNLHVECFKCSTCGSSLKNQGYYNLNGKLYCDIHAKLVARQNPPAPNLEPVTVPPGGRVPSNTYSTPLPPISTNNYSNGSSALFSPSSNLSGPKPFGSSIGSAYSPSLSPRSAPMSPARPVNAPTASSVPAYAPAPAPVYAPAPTPAYTPAPAYAPAPAPVPAAPFAPINETQTIGSIHKPEFKSPAEERLIRKMAKMALNGYEIGIQRKIKPGDHIQTMADKIQDTVVTKHPLNSDNVSSGENSRDSTLRRPIQTNIDKIYKAPDPSIVSIGDKIKETIMINHPANANPVISNASMSPPPPPLPCSPIPALNAHSTPKKQSDFLSNKNQISNVNNYDKSYNGSDYSSSEDSNKDKPENNYSDTLNKRRGFEKSSFLNGMNNSNYDTKPQEIKFETNFSNTLSKRKIFERDTQKNPTGTLDTRSKIADKSNNIQDTWTKSNIFEKSKDEMINTSLNQNDDLPTKKGLTNSLHDNTLYTYKPSITENNGKNMTDLQSDTIDSKETHDIANEHQDDENSDEVIVKRRQKKCIRDDDGRRDSHIIARPLSTMTAADVADGLYPVCHKCDKAIKRGPFITALGRIWCPEHFICVNATCRRPLQDIGFVEENGQLYCEYCFEQYIAPACDKCHAKIKGDCLNAIGKHFHPECFSCVYCGKLFGNNPFFLEDGLPYCEIGMNCLQRNVSLAGSPSKRATGGSRRSAITTTVSASTARCAKRTSKDRASSLKEVDHFVRLTPARSPQIIYNSDTVYSTTTFRPVSPSPITPPAPNTPSPQRTRKLETPLHFDGGLFSDIRSKEGKILSKVTVDRVQSLTQHDITDSPSAVRMQDSNNYVDDIMKTETITNKDVITVKFTPVPMELDSQWLLTPSQFIQLKSQSPAQYFKDNYEDLQCQCNDSMEKETLLSPVNCVKFNPVATELESPRLLTPSKFIKMQSQSQAEYFKDNYENLQTQCDNSIEKEILSSSVNSVKFTPVAAELESPRLLTPSQFITMQSQSPVEYIKNNYEDLHSYKIVNSLCKEKLLTTDVFSSDQHILTEKFITFNISSGNDFLSKDIADYVQHEEKKGIERLCVSNEPYLRGHSPLANVLVSEQLTKLDNYLQESLDVCLGRIATPIENQIEVIQEAVGSKQTVNHLEVTSCHSNTSNDGNKSYTNIENSSYHTEKLISKKPDMVQTESMQREGTNDVKINAKKESKLNSVQKRKAGIINTICNMPIHYHAAFVCVILIIYNLIYQYIKQNSESNKKI